MHLLHSQYNQKQWFISVTLATIIISKFIDTVGFLLNSHVFESWYIDIVKSRITLLFLIISRYHDIFSLYQSVAQKCRIRKVFSAVNWSNDASNWKASHRCGLLAPHGMDEASIPSTCGEYFEPAEGGGGGGGVKSSFLSTF
jgi:hypothetical protein